MHRVRPEIEAMAGYTPGEQPGAGKFIKLNTNENPYPAPSSVAAAVAEAVGGLAKYPDASATSFRLAAASVLDVDPEQILCGNGSDDILTILTRSFVGPGQALRLPYPSYVLYRTLAQIQGAQSEEVAFTDDWQPGAAFGQPDPDVRLAFLPNPNSPTGTVVSSSAIRELAGTIDCALVVDEAYADFADDNCLSLVQECDNVLVTRTLSKSYALAGLRFGFLVAPVDVVRQLQKVKDSYNCDTLSIAAATAAITDQAWLAENVARVKASRARLTRELRELGFDVIDSQANFVWCEHSAAPAATLYEQLKQQGVLVRYMKYSRWREGLRISVGTDEQLDVCLQLLASMV